MSLHLPRKTRALGTRSEEGRKLGLARRHDQGVSIPFMPRETDRHKRRADTLGRLGGKEAHVNRYRSSWALNKATGYRKIEGDRCQGPQIDRRRGVSRGSGSTTVAAQRTWA